MSHHNYDLVEHFTLDDVDSAFELITQVKYNQSIPMRAQLQETCRSGGNVLVATDTGGRVLEMTHMLEQMWSTRESGLSAYSLCILSNTGYHVIHFAKQMIEWMSEKLTKAFDSLRTNPFSFKHLKFCHNLTDLSRLPSPKAAGGLVLALSIWLAVDNTSFLLLTRVSDNESLQQFSQPSVMEHGAYVLIVAGGLVFLIGFLGCCGAAMESRALLTMYGLMIIVIFLLEVTGGALAAVYKAETKEELQNFLKHTLKKYYSTQSQANSVTVAWNALMAELKCCGVNNYTDFQQATMWQANKSSDVLVPRACCVLEGNPIKFLPLDPTCITNPTLDNSYYLTGCYGRLMQWVENHVNLLMGIGIGVGLFERVSMVFAFCLCSSLNHKIK